MDLRERASNMEKQQKHIPQLRFPEFQNDGEWEVKRLGEIAERIITRNKDNEVYPVLTNSATEGVINQQDYFDREIVSKDKLTNYHIIKFDDFVYNPRISTAAPVGPISRNKIGTGIMSPLYTIFRFKVGNIDFLEQYFRTNCWHQYLKDRANFGARFDRMNITSEDFLKLPLPFPPLAEQQRIAIALSEFDTILSATKDKLEQLKAYKNGLMQKLFPAKGKTLPEYRFKDFVKEEEWKVKKLGDFLFEHKTKSDGKCQVYSISVSKGVINQMEYLGRCFAAADTSNYKLVKPYDIVYTKSPTGDFPYGIVKQSFVDHNVIVSPLYGVFSPNNKYIGYIIHSYFESSTRINNYLAPIVQKGAKNTIQITNDVFLSQNVCFPTNENEQCKIASCLFLVDETINTYTEKVVQMEQLKKGLMQRMFPTLK